MTNTREKLIELLESSESAIYWNSNDKSFVEKIADHLIANGVTVQEWFSVKDRLPEVGEAVLVFRDGGFAISEIYMIDYEENQMWSYTGVGGDATHWMPLPRPPKGE